MLALLLGGAVAAVLTTWYLWDDMVHDDWRMRHLYEQIKSREPAADEILVEEWFLDQAHLRQKLSTVMFGIGLVSLIGMLFVWLCVPSLYDMTRFQEVVPWLLLGAATCGFTGAQVLWIRFHGPLLLSVRLPPEKHD